MFKFILAIFSILAVSKAAKINSRIVGGDDAPMNFAPYLVSFQDLSFNHICVGTLFNSRWVITSATCAKNDRIKLVVPGVSILASDAFPEYAYHVANKYINPNFNERYNLNNIALVKTLQAVINTTTVRPISLATSSPAVGSTMTMVGWDHNQLKSLTTTVISNDVCAKDLVQPVTPAPNVIYGSHLCGMRSKGRGVCIGDTGVGLVAGNTLYGVVGYVPNVASQCATGIPEAYIRVSSFYSWICNIMYVG